MTTVQQRAIRAATLQADWEDQLAALLDRHVERFLSGIVAYAGQALDATVLLAAPDPFAFTNVWARWRTAVGLIMNTPRAQIANPALLDEVLEHALMAADLPHRATALAADVLKASQVEAWTKAQTRRELRAVLIPSPPPGAEAEKRSGAWSWHKARVRQIARTAATRAAALDAIANAAGAPFKRWVTRRDPAVRDTHAEVHGQTVPEAGAFSVGGHAMQYPGDPSAPYEQTVNCRCVLVMLTVAEAEGETMPLPYDLTASAAVAAGVQTWKGPIAFEGVIVGGGPARMIEAGALTWDESLHPLRHLEEDRGNGHDGAFTVGRIDTVTRSGNAIVGEGIFDTGSARGVEATRLVAERLKTGVSVDLDEVAFEIRVRKELLAEVAEIGEDDEGSGPAIDEGDSDGMVVVESHSPDDEVMVITSAVLRGATIADIPAFADARIELVAAPAGEPAADSSSEGPLAASGGPSCPPAVWFTDPGLSGMTPLTITDEGRVFAHLAAWDTSHISFSGETVKPPRSATAYAYFHTGAVHALSRSGQIAEIATGRLTVNTGHASPGLAASSALAHYDNTGTAVADVRVGEDAFGIWVAGALRPTATDEQVRVLRASPLSGDWRRIGGNLELVAALAVNVPGFPIPRPAGFVAAGRQLSLVASGIVTSGDGRPAALPAAELAFVRRLMDERAGSLAAQARAMNVRARADRVARRGRVL